MRSMTLAERMGFSASQMNAMLMAVSCGKACSSRCFLQAVCLAQLPFGPVAVDGVVQSAFGYAEQHLDGRSCGGFNLFEGGTQRVGRERLAAGREQRLDFFFAYTDVRVSRR